MSENFEIYLQKSLKNLFVLNVQFFNTIIQMASNLLSKKKKQIKKYI
jgi:hypothetical protein